jgi:rRNA maturation protein Nop10
VLQIVVCPECGRKVLDVVDRCPGCAYPLKKAHPAQYNDQMKDSSSKKNFAHQGMVRT